MEYILERTQFVPVSIQEAFAFFSKARNLEEITPSWLRFEVLRAPDRIGYGSLLAYRLELFRVPIHWLTRIATWQPPRSFADEQISGPYPLWEHTHRFLPDGTGCLLDDEVLYTPPYGAVGRLAGDGYIQGMLERTFRFRHARTRAGERHDDFKRPRQRSAVIGSAYFGSRSHQY